VNFSIGYAQQADASFLSIDKKDENKKAANAAFLLIIKILVLRLKILCPKVLAPGTTH
jgi:hypothetical protein